MGSGVYPRGCGGAIAEVVDCDDPTGLSPRVRGSLPAIVGPAPPPGSIPAGAGEPNRRRHQPRRYRVYPRGCGGASLFSGDPATRWGLSPRVRGSPMRCDVVVRRHGSIPAGAGEPGPTRFQAHQIGVYPRGCGGAISRASASDCCLGLSPRVRGSHPVPFPSENRLGSIPAGAGEPRSCFTSLGDAGVYPRGCGGAMCEQMDKPEPVGLSPRVRGSHKIGMTLHLRPGSIPAGAGEP